MKLTKLKMKAYRGFKQAEIEFDPHLTLLVGINGAGKTTVLDALAVLMSQLFFEGTKRSSEARQISEVDIRIGHSFTQLEIELLVNEQMLRWKSGLKQPQQTLFDLTPDDASDDERAKLREAVLLHADALALAVYYPVNRAVRDIPQRARRGHAFGKGEALDGAFEGGRSDFRRFFEWFREREDVENQHRLRVDSKYRDPQLSAARLAVELLVLGFTDVRIDRSPPRMFVTKAGVDLQIEQLSEGEKCMLALAGDLARRLAIANPDRIDPLNAEAIIWIDEVELHLHLGWQRTLVGALRRTFPNCQFILTTHSPQVLAAVPTDSVRLLENFEITKPDVVTEGRDPSALLRDFWGIPVRPDWALEAIRDVEQRIDKEDYEGARQALSRLATRLSTQDDDITRLQTHLDFIDPST